MVSTMIAAAHTQSGGSSTADFRQTTDAPLCFADLASLIGTSLLHARVPEATASWPHAIVADLSPVPKQALTLATEAVKNVSRTAQSISNELESKPMLAGLANSEIGAPAQGIALNSAREIAKDWIHRGTEQLNAQRLPLSSTILAWVRRNVARRDRQLRQQQQLATSATNEAGVEALLGSTFRAEESMDATHMKETFIAGSQSTATSPATLAIYTRPSDIIAFWSHCAKVLTSMLKQVAANPSDPTNVASRVEEALRVGGHADCPSLLSALLQVRRDLRTALLKAVEIFKSLYPLSPFTAAVDGGQTAAPLPPLKSAAMGLPALFHLYATAWKRCLHLTSQDLLALLTASIDTVIRLTECHIVGPNALHRVGERTRRLSNCVICGCFSTVS
jgi:hypothetical protein